MSPLFGKKKQEDEKKEELKGKGVASAYTEFRDKLYEKIDKSAYELVDSFLIPPSKIKEIDPTKKLEEARDERKNKKRTDATRHYREAILTIFFKDVKDFDKIFKEYTEYINELLEEDRRDFTEMWYQNDLELIKAYNGTEKMPGIKENPAIKKALIETYRELSE